MSSPARKGRVDRGQNDYRGPPGGAGVLIPLAQGPQSGADLIGEGFRLLPGREVPAFV